MWFIKIMMYFFYSLKKLSISKLSKTFMLKFSIFFFYITIIGHYFFRYLFDIFRYFNLHTITKNERQSSMRFLTFLSSCMNTNSSREKKHRRLPRMRGNRRCDFLRSYRHAWILTQKERKSVTLPCWTFFICCFWLYN